MTALVAATNRIKGGVWFMFGLVTLIQMIGNIFYSFKEIDANGDLFKSWVELTSPLWEMLGSDPGDIISQKRWLAFLEGGLLPIISLTSLHFFTKYDRNRTDEKEEVKEVPEITKPDEDITEEEYNDMINQFVKNKKEEADKLKYTPNEEDLKKLDDFLSKIGYDGPKKDEVDESSKFTPNEDELKKIEDILSKYSKPEVVEFIQEEIQQKEEQSILTQITELMKQPEEELTSSDSEFHDTEEEINQVIDDLEFSPEPIEEVKTNKVLNYFK
jgi:hypothetical protein